MWVKAEDGNLVNLRECKVIAIESQQGGRTLRLVANFGQDWQVVLKEIVGIDRNPAEVRQEMENSLAIIDEALFERDERVSILQEPSPHPSTA